MPRSIGSPAGSRKVASVRPASGLGRKPAMTRSATVEGAVPAQPDHGERRPAGRSRERDDRIGEHASVAGSALLAFAWRVPVWAPALES